MKLFPIDWFFNLLLFVVMLFLLKRLKNYFRAVNLAFNLPGPVAYPIIGNSLTIMDNEELFMIGNHGYSLFGPIMRCWVSVIPFFALLDPSHIQAILCNGKLTEKNMFYTLMHNFIGEGLITNNGEKWRTHRKLIQPYFHMNKLETLIPVFAETSNRLVKEFNNVGVVNVTQIINKWVVRTLHKTVLGISMTDEEFLESPFRKGEVFVPYRISRPWLLLDSIFGFTKYGSNEKKQRSKLFQYTKTVLEKVRANAKPPPEGFVSMLEVLMHVADSNPRFTDEDIINEASTLMLAGQDSVGAAVAFSLYFLAKYQDVQTKVLEEQLNIFEKSSRSPELNDLNEMKYLEQCIKEAMRLCPSVPIICRELKEDVVLGKHTIPAKSNIIISPFATHRLEYLYPEPLKFDPERFSSQRIGKLHPYGYLPFSAGQRDCIGYKFALLEMKTVISAIIREYHLSLVPGKEELNFSYRITLRAKGGIWLNLTPRVR